MQCTWVFSIPYSTVLTFNVFNQMEPCFVRKKKTKTLNPYCEEIMLSITELPHNC